MGGFERVPFDDFELTSEQEAELKRAIQDCNDGLTYTMLIDEDNLSHRFRCNKCQREGKAFERPFPHKLDCPLRKF